MTLLRTSALMVRSRRSGDRVRGKEAETWHRWQRGKQPVTEMKVTIEMEDMVRM